MKEDLLEKFIKDHLHEWDDKTAPPEVWEKISDLILIPEEAAKPSNLRWKGLALVLGILLASLIVYMFLSTDKAKDVKSPNQNLEFAELPDFTETEEYYLSAIFASKQKVQQHLEDLTLEEDLKMLDQSTNNLRQDYTSAQGAYKENILRAIILNHQMKLQILERVLNNIENSKLERNEKVF